MRIRKPSIGRVWQRIKHHFRIMGQQTVYAALLMVHAFRRKETPLWAKNIIVGALGYLLAPFDAVPDLTPIIGYTDDLGVLTFGLVTIASYINHDVRIEARKRVKALFGTLDVASLQAVDEKL
ncbi:MAG: DUF1232 domain-containing protein [Saprospiraceae bacterium]|nr:DUF1232 domain-containing protein [Saprospiraceae bacterium]